MGYQMSNGQWANTKAVSLFDGTATETGAGEAVELGDRGSVRLTLDVTEVEATGINEVQELAITDADGGTFTLTFDGDETDPIAYDATAEAVQAALEALESIGEGNVEVTGGPLPASPITITFVGDLGEQNVAALVPDDTLLTAPAPAVEITEVTTGGAGVNEVQRIAVLNATGGTFTLSFDGKTTSAIAFDADAAAIESALEGLESIGVGNVGVTADDDGSFLVEFKGSLEETDVALITANAGSLTGATAAAAITTVTPGAAGSASLDVTVQTGPDGSTWTTLDTFTQATAPGTQRKIMTAVDRWVRVSYTIGGTGSQSVTFSLTGEAV